MDELRSTLRSILLEARNSGQDDAVISAGELHRVVGGYPTPFNRMPMCCKVMYEEQRPGDVTLAKPPKDFGASLAIKYRLPRH
jgi:hypothetical protein